MEASIISKLNKFFASGVHNEESVVYVLIEICKLPDKDNYPAVRFYRDWAAHVELTGKDAQEFMKEIGQIYYETEDFLKDQRISKIISFDRLKDELKKFADDHRLNGSLLSDENWNEFGRLLLSVLEDCPLNGESGTSLIKKYSLNSGFDDKSIVVNILFKDGVHYSGTTNFQYLWWVNQGNEFK